MNLEFRGIVFQWRGPAPFFFVALPDEQAETVRAASKLVTYGWGMIPVTVRVGSTEWTTSLFPKEGRYLVPLKDKVRAAEELSEGDEVAVRLELGRKPR